MRRRGNKSSKVPNVKLRPAEKGSYSRPIVESCWAQETQPGSDDTVVFDLCPRPLKGIAICATGVPDKPTLFKQAVELGATCTPAFTDRVTHLVAVDHGGAKYMCALERKIPIVMPSWITENYQIWLRGDDVDAVKTVEKHRLPIFSGVIVCPSGITDITRRTQISKLVTAHDGHYLKNLERPVKVTHLLCSGDEETEKMQYAEKFNSRGEAKIHLVWEEWFWDSLDFGGRFDEAIYQVRRPRPERKTLPEAASSPPPSSSIPSDHDEIPSSSAANPRRPQTNDGDPEEEPAFVNVLPKVTLQLWSSLLDRRGYQVADGEVILSPSKADVDDPAKNPEPRQVAESQTGMKFGAARSVLSSFRRANSFAPSVEAKRMPGPSRQLPFRRTSTSTAAAFGDNTSKAGPSKPAGEGLLRKASPGDEISGPSRASPVVQIFTGMKLRILGEMRSPNVRNAILQLGGMISTDEDEEVDFIVVRLVSGSKFYRDEEDEAVRAKYRTECWLEQCIFDERLCSAEEQVTFLPLVIQIPVPGAESVILAISGFSQSEKYGLQRLFRALGITLAPVFTRRSTHLLCPSGTGQKFDKAHEWGIPVVGFQWLSAITTSGLIPSVDGFVVPGHVNEKIDTRKDLKGKGKAVDKGKERATSYDMDIDPDNRMNDITNNTNPQLPPNPLPNATSTKKPKTVERQATTIIPNPGRPETIVFGMPDHTLGGSFAIHPSSIPTPTRSLILPGTPKGESSRLDSFSSHSHTKGSLIVENNNANSTQQQQLQQRQPTIPHLETNQPHEHDRGLDRVPSSTSPSPMKVPRTGSRLSLSPVKIDHEVTKALQESITSLLGKRPSPDADADELGGARAGGTTGGVEVTGPDMPQRKKGKRVRPQRTKPSRQPSSAKIVESETLTRSKTDQPRAAGFGGASDALNPFESYPDDHQAGKSQQEESMRVMYEDPGQQEEKKRLMRLLKGQTGDEESIGTSMTLSGSERRKRRSTRIAGF